MATTNNVTRFLTNKRIPFEPLESEPIKRSAQETAALFMLDPEKVYKTIVVKRAGKGKPILCMIPAYYTVDLKKTAQAVQEKKVFLTTMDEAEKLTGLLAGGISPLTLIQHGFQMIIHSSIRETEWLTISGGQRGLTIRLASQSFLTVLNPIIADIAKPPSVE